MPLKPTFLLTISLWQFEFSVRKYRFSPLCSSLPSKSSLAELLISIFLHTISLRPSRFSPQQSPFFQPLPVAQFQSHFHIFSCRGWQQPTSSVKSVFVFYSCCNTFSGFRQHKCLTLHYWRIELALTCCRGCMPSGASGGESIILPFPVSRVRVLSRTRDPFFCLPSQQHSPVQSHSLSFPLSHLCFCHPMFFSDSATTTPSCKDPSGSITLPQII